MTQQSSIRALIWDLGGVLVRTHDHRGRIKWEERLGLQPHELERTFFSGEAGERAMIGDGDADDVWDWVLNRFQIPIEEKDVLIEDFWSGDRVDRDLIATIHTLRPRYRIALLSNAFRDLRMMLKDVWGFADLFDDMVISAEAGLRKPDPRIYPLALQSVGAEPHEAIFIDDFVENIEAAQRGGLQTVHFRSREQALSNIADLLGHEI